jgi:tRNA threonylcarbamoyladenosine biosynthesis protein TsaB
MDQVYTGRYTLADATWRQDGDFALLAPEEVEVPDGCVLAGNAGAVYDERLAGSPGIAALPSAESMLRLAPQLLEQGLAIPAAQALPRYVRDKVAKTTAERMAERASA